MVKINPESSVGFKADFSLHYKYVEFNRSVQYMNEKTNNEVKLQDRH